MFGIAEMNERPEAGRSMTMQEIIATTRFARILGAAAIVLALGAQLASAQNFPSGRDGGFNERDAVTGYLCVTPGCDVLRMSEASCICVKQNPSETKLSKLRLTCSKRENGAWVACPVKPRYGNAD
jgi:hypothetical protein